MTVSISDYLSKASNGTAPVVAHLASQKAFGASSLSLDSSTGWDTSTPVHFLLYQVDAQNAFVPGSLTIWKGILSGTTVSTLTLKSGTDTIYPGGSAVELAPTSAWADDLITGLQQHMNPDGSLIPAAVKTALGISNVAAGWTPLGFSVSSIANNGQRNYNLVFNSNDITGIVSNGMRLLLPRSSAAPTKCTSLNGSNQYYSKSSPAGMTFTDDFTVSAWIKLTSYAAGTIVSRYNGTSGWTFELTSTGQITMAGFNAGSGNNAFTLSVRSVPLNKWVHVAGELDMSSIGTKDSTHNYIMVDGLDTPITTGTNGSNPTALIQAGNLEVGGRNAGTQPFPGKIAQVAVYNAKVTQANVLATISQTLAGSETSLISAYSFNNTINDLNANANNLTAQNSAVATNADSPFAGALGTNEYGIIMANTFSTNTTLTVQVPEGYMIPTTGGLGTISYSTHEVPYGFPGQKGRWYIESIYRTAITQSSPTTNQFYNLNTQIVLGIGNYMVGWEGILESGLGSAGTFSTKGTLSSTNNGETYPRLTSISYSGSNATSSGQSVGSGTHKETQLELAAQTTMYFNMWSNLGASSLTLDGASGDCVLFAVNAYV